MSEFVLFNNAVIFVLLFGKTAKLLLSSMTWVEETKDNSNSSFVFAKIQNVVFYVAINASTQMSLTSIASHSQLPSILPLIFGTEGLFHTLGFCSFNLTSPLITSAVLVHSACSNKNYKDRATM